MEFLFLTTQPGWAFATLGELRSRGAGGYVGFAHRDSSLLVEASHTLQARPLLTVADAYGGLVYAEAGGRHDATTMLAEQIDPGRLRTDMARWLPPTSRQWPGHFSIGAEVWGNTALHRKTLRSIVARALGAAFPRLSEQASGGLRLLVKADTQAAVLGVRLYSNVDPAEASRSGTLREHLACSLLVLAGVRRDDTVVDPFMGTGTILHAAQRHFGVRRVVGVEIDQAAYRIARRSLRHPGNPVNPRTPGSHGGRGPDRDHTVLLNRSFDQLDTEALPTGAKLVSNIPFGVQFEQVPVRRLTGFLTRLERKLAGTAMLLGREQAPVVARALDMRTKNVLVLGQPASVVYHAYGPARPVPR